MNGAKPCGAFLVGGGLLPNASCQSISISLTHRFREQARSHIYSINQKWKLVLNNAVRPAAWLAKWVEKALS